MKGLHSKWPLVTYFLVNRELNAIALPDLLARKDGVMNSAFDWTLTMRSVGLAIVTHSLINTF